jgi:glycosyltransferase involved in cell wall biosynthesis
MDRSLHVAVVTETWPPEVNGVALTVQNLLQGLRDSGHRVSLVRPRPGTPETPMDGEMQVRSLPLPRYPGLRLGITGPAPLLERWQGDRPDALYVATEGPLGWAALSAAARLRLPAASGFHTRFDEYVTRYGLGCLSRPAFAWLRCFHNRASATIVPTRELASWLSNRGFDRVTRLHRAVDSQLFDPARRSEALRLGWGVERHQLVVVHVGRIAAEKNLGLAVSAFRAVQQRHPDARMVWVGDGPARRALAAANPDFVFVGVQRGVALARHFASADLFLFPSLTETFGNVTLEAMASGVATVAFDYAAAREHLRDGVDGFAIAERSESAFVEAALLLAASPELRARMGHAARQAMQQLDPSRVTADFAALLARLPAVPA